MTTTINADSSNGFKVTADTSSILALQTNGTTAISIDASQAVSFTNQPTYSSGTANGVAYLNGSKVLTTGSALVFDGTNLGIGTSSPAYKLDVLGNVNRFAGASVDGIFLSTVAATDISYYGANYYNNNGTEGVNASGRASWRIATLTSGSPTFSIGYRAASAGAGVFSTPLTIDSSGNLGIGATAPQNKLQVVTTTRPQFSVSYNGTTGLYLEDGTNSSWKSWKLSTSFGNGSDLSFVQSTNTSGTPTWAATAAMTLDASGNLLVGTTTGASSTSALMQLKKGGVQWDTGPNGSNGGFNVLKDGTTGVYLTSGATAWSGLSDETMKDIIEPIENASQKISTLRTVIGKYKTDEEGTRRAFLIAQDVKEVLPEAVNENENGKLGLQYTDVMPLLVAAIKEQQALITTLTARITALESA